MINLILSELYRLIRSKCTYVILILSAMFMILNPLLFKTVEPSIDKVSQYVDEAKATDDNFQVSEGSGDVLFSENIGFSSFSNEKWFDHSYQITILDFVQENISGMFLLLFIVIFSVIFLNGEIKNGYIKSIMAYVGKRRRLAVAAFISVETILIVIFIINFVLTALISLLLFDNIKLGSLGDFIPWYLIQFLMHSAFLAVMMFFTYLVRSTAFSMSVGICISAGFGSLISTILSLGAVKVFKLKNDFSLAKYTITQNIMSFTPGETGEALNIPVIIGAVGLILFFTLSCFVLEKKDIR